MIPLYKKCPKFNLCARATENDNIKVVKKKKEEKNIEINRTYKRTRRCLEVNTKEEMVCICNILLCYLQYAIIIIAKFHYFNSMEKSQHFFFVN
jgi:hypothetical protein